MTCSENTKVGIILFFIYTSLPSLGLGSAVGEKGKKTGSNRKISASQATRAVSKGGGKGVGALPPFPIPRLLLSSLHSPIFFSPTRFFSPFSYNAEPDTRLWFASRKCIYTINDQIVALSQIIAFYLMNVPSSQTFV